MEEGAVDEIFRNSHHPYTRGLFGCIPNMTADKNSNPLTPIRGQLPLATNRPKGCYFGPRCDFFIEEQCGGSLIPETPADKEGHLVRCNRWREIDWENHKPDVNAREKVNIGDTIVRVRDMKKHYELPSESLFGGGAKKSKRCKIYLLKPSKNKLSHCRRIRMRQIHLCKSADGLGRREWRQYRHGRRRFNRLAGGKSR